MKKICFYHVNQAKRYSSYLAAYINKQVSDEQFTKLCNIIDDLRQLTNELYEESKKQ